ncbi:MAG: hypothetical protein R2827_00040 [Bdellovibrionales bacterium]
MDDENFEGTLVLESLAEIDKVEEFLDAVDSDDFVRAKALMVLAEIDQDTISTVLKKMREADGSH